MKRIQALCFSGYQMLSRRGKVTLIMYTFSLSIIVVLDLVALYLLSTAFMGLQSNSSNSSNYEPLKLAIVVVLFILRSTLSMVISYIGLHELAKDEVEIGQTNFENFIAKPWVDARTDIASNLYLRVDRAPNAMIQNFLVLATTIIAESFGAILIFGALAFIQPLTAITAASYFILIAFAQHRILSTASSRAGEGIVKRHNEVYDLLNDAFGLSRILRIMPSKSLLPELRRRRHGLAVARAQAMFLNMIPRYFMESVLAFGFIVIAGVSAYVNGPSSVFAAITIFAAAGFRLLPIINRIQGLVLTLYSAYPLAKESVLPKEKPEILNEFGPAEKQNLENLKTNVAISLKDLTFRFPDGAEKAINHIDLEFEKGKSYALVGPSGSGKSTLVDLCLKLLLPTGGKVIWADDIQLIGYVPQDSFMSSQDFNSNVAIEWSANQVDDAVVASVAKQAQITEFLNYNRINHSFTRSDIRTLSGGQKQRVALARALYRNPQVLVLDEPTSALDAELETEIMDTIWSLEEDLTVIIVAHRLKTIESCDQIIYIKNGEVLAKGTFAELKKLLPEFAKQIDLGTFSN